jgi:hypothetical protein
MFFASPVEPWNLPERCLIKTIEEKDSVETPYCGKKYPKEHRIRKHRMMLFTCIPFKLALHITLAHRSYGNGPDELGQLPILPIDPV